MKRLIPILFAVFACSAALSQPEDIKKLEDALSTKTTDTGRINALNALANKYMRVDLKRADSINSVVQQQLASINYTEGKIANLNSLSYSRASLGKSEEATGYSDEAMKMSEELGNSRLLAETYNYRTLLFFMRGDYKEAMPNAEKASAYALEAKNDRLIGSTNEMLGVLNGLKGDHAKAVDFFLKALDVHERANNLARLGLVYNQLGHAFEEAQNYPKALEYLGKPLDHTRKTGDRSTEGWVLTNIGVVFSRSDGIDTSLVLYHQSLKIAEETSDLRLLLTCLDNIGGINSRRKDFKTANAYLNRAYRIAVSSGRNTRLVFITGNLAENYRLMGRLDSARYFGEKQLEMAVASGLASEQRVAYETLADVYTRLNDYKSASRVLRENLVLSDSIFNKDKSQQLEKLREEYETEKREQEIASLKTINETERLKNTSYAAAAGLFLIAGGLLYYIQRQRTVRNRLLFQKEQEVDKLKTQFFTNMSHEFRTPLTLILGPVSELIENTKDESTRKQLLVMQRNANRLLELINQLLDISRLESGKMKLMTTGSDIMTTIQGVAMSFHSSMEQKGIELILNLSPSSLTINFDRPKLETILINLIANALKFTPRNGDITVASRILPATGKLPDRLEISVTDTGSGIPAKDIEHIFNRFYQSDTNMLLQQEGSGIGLALAKELVDLHGGRIYPTSEDGRGTTITFEIPTNLQHTGGLPATSITKELTTQRKALEPLDPVDDEEAFVSDGRPVVLVVEDHEEVRAYLQDVMKDKFTLMSARNGEEGINRALESIPDIVISDVMMPIKDGYELSRVLKNDERTSHIPIILLTAKTGHESRIDGLKANADDYMTKPFVPAELLIRVDNLVASRRMLREKYSPAQGLKPFAITEDSIDDKFMTRLMQTVEKQLSNEQFGVEELSREMGLSRSQLHRKLTALIDQGPNKFIRKIRLTRAHELLAQRAVTPAEAAYRVGFGSPSYFTKCFHEQFGYTPSEIPEKR